MNAFFVALIKRDLILTARNPGEWVVPLAFFLLVVVIFPLAVSPAAEDLRLIAPGVVWAMALLSVLLSQDSLFRQDNEDGTLEQILLAPQSLILVALAKAISHWLAYGLPLLVFTPLLGVWMYMRPEEIGILLLTLPLGTGVFSLFTVFSSALLAGARRYRFLGSLIALPLCLPAVIFASTSIYSYTIAPALLLAAFFTLSLTILPLVTASVLRQFGGEN